MKLFKKAFMFALLAAVFYSCEVVDEPIDIDEGAVPGFVTINNDANVSIAAGSSVNIVIELGQTQEEDVTYEFSISGTATAGSDYTITNSSGSSVISYNPDETTFDRDTLTVRTPIDAAFGTSETLVITLDTAYTASGKGLSVGRAGEEMQTTITINGLGEVQEGTYAYEADGSFGAFAGEFDVSQPANPIEVDGNPYLYEVSNLTGTLFGEDSPIPFAFNVTAAGEVIGAPYSHVVNTVILDLTGTYTEGGETTLVFDVVFQCCGAAGAGYTMEATLQ